MKPKTSFNKKIDPRTQDHDVTVPLLMTTLEISVQRFLISSTKQWKITETKQKAGMVRKEI